MGGTQKMERDLWRIKLFALVNMEDRNENERMNLFRWVLWTEVAQDFVRIRIAEGLGFAKVLLGSQ
jgi:hypothetical protein